MIRLSFIVPFYGVELYIEECIRSLYAQDIPLEEYEVICVDDCSRDRSRDIILKLQQEFPTLKLISHERNKKLGGARNTGVKEANGQYIWFVDSDDYISPNVLGKLLSVAEENNLEILQFDHIHGGECENKECKVSETQQGESYLFNHTNSHWTDRICGAWKQLFRSSFLIENDLQYIEEAMYEDTDYLLHAFLVANKVQYISCDAYHYRINNESVTNAPISPQKLAWRVNQIARCAALIDMAQTDIGKKHIATMVSNVLSQLRQHMKGFTITDKTKYFSYLANTRFCKSYMSWRTWFALKLGITWFYK